MYRYTHVFTCTHRGRFGLLKNYMEKSWSDLISPCKLFCFSHNSGTTDLTRQFVYQGCVARIQFTHTVLNRVETIKLDVLTTKFGRAGPSSLFAPKIGLNRPKNRFEPVKIFCFTNSGWASSTRLSFTKIWVESIVLIEN